MGTHRCVLEHASTCTKAQVLYIDIYMYTYVYMYICRIYLHKIHIQDMYLCRIYVYIQDIYNIYGIKTRISIPSHLYTPPTLIFLLIGLICHSRISGPYIWQL